MKNHRWFKKRSIKWHAKNLREDEEHSEVTSPVQSWLSLCFEGHLLFSLVDQLLPPARPPKLLSIKDSGLTLRSAPCYSSP